MNDVEIQRRVEANVRKELGASADLAAIDITTRNGVVMLRGSVPSSLERWVAERAAERVPGVVGIVSELNADRPSTRDRTDEQVAEAVVRTLSETPTVPAGKIKVEVRGGWVTLRGHVEWSYQRSTAEHAVRELVGVKGVSNLVSRRLTARA